MSTVASLPAAIAENLTGQMRAARLSAPRTFEIVTVGVPEPAPHQVLVRLEGCGICGSNLPVFEGRPWFEYPLAPGAPGHEGWGRIVSTGSAVTRFAAGDRVGLLSSNAFAEYDVAGEDALVRLPESLGDAPFPAEPLACAFNVLRRSEIAAGERVAVVGSGFLGVLLIRLAADKGARVTAFSRRQFALELSLQAGAEDAFELTSASSAPGQEGFDCVIEAAGIQQTLDIASQLTKIRGRLIIAGYHQDGLRQVNLQDWNWKGLDVINAHERDPRMYVQGMEDAVRAAQATDLGLGSLCTHRFPLDRIGEAFHLLESRPDGFLKALLLL